MPSSFELTQMDYDERLIEMPGLYWIPYYGCGWLEDLCFWISLDYHGSEMQVVIEARVESRKDDV